jgi:hypothetical protein
MVRLNIALSLGVPKACSLNDVTLTRVFSRPSPGSYVDLSREPTIGRSVCSAIIVLAEFLGLRKRCIIRSAY